MPQMTHYRYIAVENIVRKGEIADNNPIRIQRFPDKKDHDGPISLT